MAVVSLVAVVPSQRNWDVRYFRLWNCYHTTYSAFNLQTAISPNTQRPRKMTALYKVLALVAVYLCTNTNAHRPITFRMQRYGSRICDKDSKVGDHVYLWQDECYSWKDDSAFVILVSVLELEINLTIVLLKMLHSMSCSVSLSRSLTQCHAHRSSRTSSFVGFTYHVRLHAIRLAGILLTAC